MTHIRRVCTATLFAAVAAGVLWLAARPDGYAADKGDPEKAASPLDYVPANAAAVVSIRWADCWDQPVLKPAFHAYMKDLPGALDNFRGYYGVEPDDLDRLVLFSLVNPHVLGPYGPSLEPCVVVTTRKPYDRKAILDAAAPGAREEKIKERAYYTKDGMLWYAFLDDRTYVLGGESWMKPYLSLPAVVKDGPMAPVLKLAAEKHLIVAGANVGAIAKTAPPADKLPPEFQPFKPFLQTQLATLTVDLDEQLRADLKLTFAKDADAKDGAAAVDDALDLARGGLVQATQELDKQEGVPQLLALLKDARAALRQVKAEQKGATVEATASLKLDPDRTTAALAEGVEVIRKAGQRIRMSNDLKRLDLAMHVYHDSCGHFPAAAVYDKNGKPLLSWRVLLLPYLDQNDLYKQFHLDEPWDSDHNKKLLVKMPAVFEPADSEAFKMHETYFQAFVGDGSVFEGTNPKLNMATIASLNGMSNTILFVEAKKAVPWTKPEDIPFDEGKLVPKLGGVSKGGFLAAFCDGSIRFLPLTVDEKSLHRAVEFRNLEPFSLDK